MTQDQRTAIEEICKRHGRDRTRLMDIARAVQERFGGVSGEAAQMIARQVGVQRGEVASMVSFYSFLSAQPKGKVVIRLCDDIIDQFHGAGRVAQVLSEELGIGFGQTTPEGHITLEYTPCIGMPDQAPAALVNEVVLTSLSTDRAREVVRDLRAHLEPGRLVDKFGDGNNAHPLVRAMVHNNIRQRGPVVLAEWTPGAALKKALAMSPAEVIRELNTARLRGRGGAGFPTGMKWQFTRNAAGPARYVICNADEGEPGTFKDRVILTECPDLMFEGMTIGGYAIGASEGIIYLRGEYAYLHKFLEQRLLERRHQRLLGRSIGGREGFDFDIRIQLGAGAYICGEETALISSCEGLRGDPKNRPPFPAERGYLGAPTVVNNAETFCCAARILEKGSGWFAQLGSKGSAGTKLLSISGDCKSPGVYEVPFGVELREVLEMAGAEDAAAVQVGGASGQLVGPAAFERTICYDDLATGGAVMVFGPQRDVLEIAHRFMDFFVQESCGYCTPCRVGNVLLKKRLEKIIAGYGEPADLDYLQELGEAVRLASRCGLGQTSPRPVLSTLENFRAVYEARLSKTKTNGWQPTFDLEAAVAEAARLTGRVH
ncbi:MAG: NAD(P)H-dependent oxidoreductase subunit E [Candidatus Latescibacteria bacterium]|nr:NAD(P)H-dependent oxidoreductase subunit E [Candidatus Latescibacterota bacterium]